MDFFDGLMAKVLGELFVGRILKMWVFWELLNEMEEIGTMNFNFNCS